jgi:phospholipase C
MRLGKPLLCGSLIASAAVLVAAHADSTGTAVVGARAPADPVFVAAQVDALATATPIKHLVIIYHENVSFDHYFATYPHATNPDGEPGFTALPGTPEVNNLVTARLLTKNPNDTNPANGANAADPFRLDRTQAATADQNHSYTPEQQAYDGGRADLFPEYTGHGTSGGVGAFGTQRSGDGLLRRQHRDRAVAYAQHFALSDNAYTNTYGPSTPGALEVVSGQTNGCIWSPPIILLLRQ